MDLTELFTHQTEKIFYNFRYFDDEFTKISEMGGNFSKPKHKIIMGGI